MPRDEAVLVSKRERPSARAKESQDIPNFRLPRLATQTRKTRDFGVIQSFRLNAEVKEKLEQLSKKMNVSTTVLANKALRKLVEWDSYAEILGIVSTRRDTLKFLWDSLPEEKARALGKRTGGPEAVDFSNFWFKKFTWDTMVEAARLWGAEYGGVYHFQHDFSEGVHTLVFFHELGPNFTAYLSEAFKETVKLLIADCEVTESEKQLVIRVKR